MFKPWNGVDKIFRVSIFYTLFLLIAEPRVIRIMLFCVYALGLWAGFAILLNLPDQYVHVIGYTLVLGFSLIIIIGSLLALIAVLPGIWWLERVGLILLATSIGIYSILLQYLSASPIAVAFILGLAIMFAIRFVEIRGAQLAPREA